MSTGLVHVERTFNVLKDIKHQEKKNEKEEERGKKKENKGRKRKKVMGKKSPTQAAFLTVFLKAFF